MDYSILQYRMTSSFSMGIWGISQWHCVALRGIVLHQDSRVAGQVRILDPVSLGEKHNIGVPVGATRTDCPHLYTPCFLSNSTAVSLWARCPQTNFMTFCSVRLDRCYRQKRWCRPTDWAALSLAAALRWCCQVSDAMGADPKPRHGPRQPGVVVGIPRFNIRTDCI